MIKLFEEYHLYRADIICANYGITNYTINVDGSVDVNDDVNLFNKKLDRLPLKFGRVNGNFYCYQNKLTSLEGCPSYVGGFFDCSYNQLTSLEGGPKEVGGSFDCSHNQLTTLEGCPTELNVNFYCEHNQLTSLEGLSKGCDLYCSLNNLTSLKGCPIGVEINTIYSNPLPKLIINNIDYINDIIKYQDDYSIWNRDGSLNKYRFNDMMVEIKGLNE